VTEPDAAQLCSPSTWVADVATALDEGYRFFDFLSVVDETNAVAETDVVGEAAGGDEADRDGRFAVVLHLWNRAASRHRFLRTTVPAGAALPSIARLLPGAAWTEREAHEMFGLPLEGAADERPLLLPDGFAGHPLRKDFPLAARGVEPWPGVHEPTEHGPAARPPGRRRPSAPGVPDWSGSAPSSEAPSGGAG
jgi:NADH-quinone oxidoreductase subunit C